MAEKSVVSMPSSKLKVAVANVLKNEGYIAGFQVSSEAKPVRTIELKYFEGRPVIEELKGASRPGLRQYKSIDQLPKVRGGLGVSIVATTWGLATGRAARAAGVGGEVVCTVVYGVLSMSRVSKDPVKLPAGAGVKLNGQLLSVKG